MSQPTDIIIAIRGTREFPIEQDFINCINTLQAHTQNYRLILVDDNSDAVAAQVINEIAARNRNTMLIRTNFQHWFSRAYNLGLRLARTQWVVMLNADTVLDAGWLDELYAVRDEATSVIGRRVGLVGSELSGEEPRRWAETQNPGYVTGHCWLVDMGALYDISAGRGQPGIYLDETRQDAIHIKSDVYACYDMNRLGWATIRSFKAAVGHIGGRAWGHNVGKALSVQLCQVNYQY